MLSLKVQANSVYFPGMVCVFSCCLLLHIRVMLGRPLNVKTLFNLTVGVRFTDCGHEAHNRDDSSQTERDPGDFDFSTNIAEFLFTTKNDVILRKVPGNARIYILWKI